MHIVLFAAGVSSRGGDGVDGIHARFAIIFENNVHASGVAVSTYDFDLHSLPGRSTV